jgi:hypothetical protein
MYYAQYGPFKFVDWTGAPTIAQTSWTMIERSGVEGVLYLNGGKSPPPFTASVMADVTDWASANYLHQHWQQYVTYPPQQLSLGGFVYPNPFKLIAVSQPVMKPIIAGFGGTTYPAVAKAIVWAQFTLREILPASA